MRHLLSGGGVQLGVQQVLHGLVCLLLQVRVVGLRILQPLLR